jgi:hypothetical protein
MKNIEKAIIICIVLLALSRLPIMIFAMIFPFLGFSTANQHVVSATVSILVYAFPVIIHIGVGIWLFNLARQEKATPWIWLLFGIFFGPLTIVLFFLWKAFNSAKPIETIAEA